MPIAPFIEKFRKLYENPYHNWSQRWPGKRAVGYLCTYVPEELIHAAGLTPIRILPFGPEASLAGAHLQSYTCFLAQSCLHQALSGSLAFLEGVFFAHTCDTMQGLADIWKEAFPKVFTEVVLTPTVLRSAGVVDYLMAELKRLASALEGRFEVDITEERLEESVGVYRRLRSLMAALNERRHLLSASDYFYAINAGMLMPKEEYIEDVEALLRELESEIPEPRQGVRILLLGSTLDDPNLLELLEKAGGLVVADDFCNGSRYFETPVCEGASPLEAIARRMLERPPCPCKYLAPDASRKRLLDLVERYHIQGVIFIRQKFCDPHAWEYPALTEALGRIKVPYLLIETERPGAPGPAVTRLQAFIEMLEEQ